MSAHLPECFYYMDDFGDGERCICDRLRACERRVLDAAREAVLAYADDTHQHVGMLKCWPENGDRCDITAALKIAATRIDALREEQK